MGAGLFRWRGESIRASKRFLYVLRFIHSTGKIEVARLQDAQSFANTFEELIREVNDADGKLKELAGYIENNQKMNGVLLESERVLSVAGNMIQERNRTDRHGSGVEKRMTTTELEMVD